MWQAIADFLNKLFARAPEKLVEKTIDPTWIKIAEGEIGQKEVRGGENPRIIEYHKHATATAPKNPGYFNEDEIAWCSSFVNFCVNKAGFKGTNNALAYSWRNYGAECELKPGAIVLISYKDSSGKVHYHVTLCHKVTGTTFQALGGNQSDSVCITTYVKSRIVTCRWPTEKDRI